MKANNFDKIFDNGENIMKYVDTTKAYRIKQKQKRVNIDFPVWMIHLLDTEAKRLGVPRESIIKVLVAEHLKQPLAA